MNREELLTDAMLFFSPNERSITAENGARYYREDVVLKAMELSGKELPLPPAEGAEEILRKPKYNSLKNLTLICEAMEEFATLHAQRIAEKMVEDKLRDELVMFGSYFNNLDPKDHILVKDIDEYLNGRNK